MIKFLPRKGQLFIFSFLVILIPFCSFAQIHAWELSASPGNQTSNTASTTVTGTTAGVLQRGSGVAASTNAGAMTSTGWFSSSSTTTVTDAITNNRYYEFTVPVVSGYQASITSVDVVVRSSNTGPNTAQLRSSADGYASSLGTITITTNSVLTSIPVSLSNLTGTVTFRLYGYGAAANSGSTPASTGTFRIGASTVTTDNDIVISGAVNAINTTWNGTTWSFGVPSASVDAIIASNTAPASFTCKSLTINSGVALNTTGITATVNGDITNSGNGLSGNGSLIIAANSALQGNAISFGGLISVNSGATLTTNNKLTLSSDASNTGDIGNSAGTISGQVTVQQYIAGGGLSTAAPSQRAFRFLAHPFNSAIALSQLQTAIDITGSGTGFDATTTNNPSAFSWNGANATSATGTSNNGGWTAFTSTTATNWAQYQGIRLFYRGAKGTGLTGAAYTVGSATLSMTGSITTGSKTINLNYPNTGTFTNLNLVGNPYASNVQMSGITNTNTTSSYYVWNLGLGNRGGYTTVAFGSSYVLPAYAAFFVESTSGTASLTFNESNKTTSAPTNSLLRTNVADNQLVLQLKSDNILWDELVLNHDTKAVSAFEYADGKKLMNPDASLYSISADGTELAIDNRNLQAGSSTALGIATSVARNFTLEVKAMGNSLQQLYLVDKYLNTTQSIEANMVYSFSTNADAASQGNARFEIVSKTINPLPSLVTNFSVKLSPNPATDVVKVAFTNTEALPTTILLKDVQGKTIKTVNAGNVQAGNVVIPVNGLSKGQYLITLTNGVDTKTEKLVIQ